MLPHALAVMRQFPFSVARPGITYLALHPVSWNEPTILERRFRPGVSPEEAVLIASDLLHEDYAYMFEAFWDLWVVAENGEWTLQPSPVKFLVHGLEFDEGIYEQEGHIQVDLGLDSPFLQEDVPLDHRGRGQSAGQRAEAGGVHQQGGKEFRRQCPPAVVGVGTEFRAEADCPAAESAVNPSINHRGRRVHGGSPRIPPCFRVRSDVYFVLPPSTFNLSAAAACAAARRAVSTRKGEQDT